MRGSAEPRERLQEQEVRMVEVELARHRLREVAVGQLDEQHVAVRGAVAQERELVLAARRAGDAALDLARVA